jgi:class 3 adenylate cyclase/tetratricopeptide (TPR) repeat protein
MPEERKLVTILFADVTGSTALGESLDPEDVRALMGRYYAHARTVVSSHGGSLEKFIGDAVMAVFGLPQAHSDDAERALSAALALREAVANDKVLAGRLALRIGINTGEVVATSDSSSGDFLITGDAVNVSARLQQNANPGESIASERTAHAAQSAFLFGEVRSIEVKGKSQPLHVFPLTAVRARRQADRPPLVGRRQDLLQLSVLQARVIEEQRPQLVSIVAPVGTGKTRLLEEFLGRLDPADGFQVATARCLPYGQTLTYWPLRDLLSELLGGEIDKSRVIDAFVKGGHTSQDAARLADLVLATLGVEREGTADRESIFGAWRLLIEALARRSPRVVIFEDLHWASDSLLDLVEHITHVRTQASLLLIALSRPELLDRRPNWGGGRQNFTALALQPLTTAQTRELVEKLMVGLHEAISDRVIERSGGNPFFALELVRGLAERGITGDATKAGTANALPDTVHAAVLARLDLLSPQERSVVQVASVSGRTFRPATLQAVMDNLGSANIDAALDGLLTRDLIAPAGGGSFTFRHVLIRDVAYGTLARAERIRLHARIAAWLESYAADHLDEFTELIAYHYKEAVLLAQQSTVPLEMPVETARAVHYLERAGELTARAGAFNEARGYLQNAIKLALESEHIRLYEKLGDCLVSGSAVVDAYTRALALWRTEGVKDLLIGARLLRKLVICHTRYSVTMRGDRSLDELAAMYTEALHLAEQAGSRDELWRVRIAQVFAHFRAENIPTEKADELRPICLAAVAHFEAHGDWAAFSEALDGYASLCWRIGAIRDALEASKRRLGAPTLSASERGDALNMIANISFALGEYDQEIAIVQEALAQVRPGEPLEYLFAAIGTSIWAAYYVGRWSDIYTLSSALEAARERLQEHPDMAPLLAAGYFAKLDVAVAREDRAAIDVASSVLEGLFTGQPVSINDLLAIHRGDDLSPIRTDTFEGDLTGGLLMPFSERGLHAPPELLTRKSFINDDLSVWCVKIAEALAAEDYARLESAIDDAEAHSLIVHAARMRIVLAQRTGNRAHLERARPVLEQLGDRKFMRRLEEVATVLN